MANLLESSLFGRMQLRIMGNLVADCTGVPRQHMVDLEAFGRFSASCAQAALGRPDGGVAVRADLTARAFKLGRRLMGVLRPFGMSPNDVAKSLYKNIDIVLEPDLPEGIVVPRCAFCAWYGPEQCAFMSAFDQGILCGLANQLHVGLCFEQRLTQGHDCCVAAFVPIEGVVG